MPLVLRLVLTSFWVSLQRLMTMKVRVREAAEEAAEAEAAEEVGQKRGQQLEEEEMPRRPLRR